MAVLADACAMVAFFAGDLPMSRAWDDAMSGEVLVSPITVWELTRKAASGKLPPLPALRGSFGSWIAAQGFRVQPLDWIDAERSNALPHLHKDPMDRMLIAQALNAGLAIVTEDRIFAAYGVPVIW